VKRHAHWNSIVPIKFITLEASAFPSEQGKHYVITVSDEEVLEPYNACPEHAGHKRYLALILAVFDLFNIPIGTAVGAYSIWVLVQDETAQLFAAGSGQ
jgi:hypothetical protein